MLYSGELSMHTHTHNHCTVIHPHKLLGLDDSEYQCIISNTILKWYYNEYLIDYGIQSSATGDMIVTQGTSILIASIILITGCNGHHDQQNYPDLGPRQCQGYSIQSHMPWQQAEQQIGTILRQILIYQCWK